MWNNAVGWWIVWFIAMQVVRSSGSGRVQRWILEYLYQPVPGYETVGWVLCRLFLIYAVSLTIILRIRDYFHRRKWKLFCVPYLTRNKKKLTNYSSNDGYVQENNIVKCNDANRVLFTFVFTQTMLETKYTLEIYDCLERFFQFARTKTRVRFI